MYIKDRGHTLPAGGLGGKECPLLTLKPYGHTLPAGGLGGKECPLYIDLHTHSTASDGSMTPAELVRYAFEKGLAAVALTDHDTVAGIRQALDEGEKLGVEVIPGVEIGVDFTAAPASEMHILGYFLHGNGEVLQETLEQLREKRNQRNPKIIHKLNELGFNITLSEVRRLAQGGVVGRPHIARAMVEKGFVHSVEEAFDLYLSSGRPAYFKKDKLLPKEGIEAIIKAGGIPVLAHPIYLQLEYDPLDELIGQLAGYGLKGIEAYYSGNTPEQTDMLITLADKNKLAVTGGSDFHGSFKPNIEIGTGKGTLKVPYDLLERLRLM